MRYFRLLIVALAVFSLFSVGETSAQRKRRKTTRKRTPVTYPALPPAQVEPAVISTADGQTNDTQTVTETPAATIENPSETPEERIARYRQQIKDLKTRVNSLETQNKADANAKQQRLLLNLEILNRAEQRSETLRKQLFEMTEKESEINSKLEKNEYDARPEVINTSLALAGSMHPEEVREQRARSLENERANLLKLQTQLQTNRATLDDNIAKADFLVERLRAKMDKEIDDALADDK